MGVLEKAEYTSLEWGGMLSQKRVSGRTSDDRDIKNVQKLRGQSGTEVH
jgi:hypothetical protein